MVAHTAAVLEQFEHWWREPEAQAILRALWGDAINDSGVFIVEEEEVLYNKDGCRAEVSIGSAHGLYAFGCHFSYPLGGCGHAPK